MKKLGLLVMPLMAISFLTNCGGGGGSTPTEDVEFSTQSEVTLDRENKKAELSLNWKPDDHSIECSDFTFTLNNQSKITSTITLRDPSSRPLKVTIDFAKALEANDKGDLKFKYNDTTAKKEGEGKVTGINVKLHENPPTPGTYTISMETEGVTITPEELPADKAYEGTIEVTAANKILNGLTSVILQDDSNTDITTHCTYDPKQDNKSASLEIPLEYLTNDIEVTVVLIDEPEPPVTGTWTLALDDTSKGFGDLKFKDQTADSVTIDEYIGQTSAVTMTFIPAQDYKTTQFTITADDTDVTVKDYLPPQSQSGEGSFSIQKADGFADGDEITLSFAEPTPPVPTDPAVEFELEISNTNADLTFTFTCDGSKELTVDWGDETKTDEHNSSHTYTTGGTYDVSIHREDITSINVTDDTSKSYLTEINFKDKITSIADEAFSSCANLTSIDIAKNVTSIGVDAFSDCNALSTIVVANGNSTYDSRDNCNAIIEKDTNTLIKGCKSSSIPNTVTAIGDNAFKNCSGLGSMGIPDSVTTIGNYAFSGCTSMTAVSFIDSSLISIGNYAFSGCSKLTFFSIPDKVTSIGDYAFSDCTSLSNIDIPDGITLVGNGAFDNCPLTYTTENNCKYLAGKSGNQYLLLIKAVDNSITSVTINNLCKVICSCAFRSCYFLSKVTISDSSLLTTIGNFAFRDCLKLTGINIPNGVTSIGDSAFFACEELSSITISNSSLLTTIGYMVFGNCSKLTSINIPDKVTSIGNSAFSGCIGLTDINIPNGVTSIGDDTFYGCSALTDITIPNGVTSVGNGAFRSCSALTDITIPNGVTSIGNSAFSGCSALTDIAIPNKVTSIGNQCFWNCSILETVDLTAFVVENPNSIPSLGTVAFYGCDALTTLKVANANMAEIFKKKSGWSEYADKIKTA